MDTLTELIQNKKKVRDMTRKMVATVARVHRGTIPKDLMYISLPLGECQTLKNNKTTKLLKKPNNPTDPSTTVGVVTRVVYTDASILVGGGRTERFSSTHPDLSVHR